MCAHDRGQTLRRWVPPPSRLRRMILCPTHAIATPRARELRFARPTSIRLHVWCCTLRPLRPCHSLVYHTGASRPVTCLSESRVDSRLATPHWLPRGAASVYASALQHSTTYAQNRLSCDYAGAVIVRSAAKRRSPRTRFGEFPELRVAAVQSVAAPPASRRPTQGQRPAWRTSS